MEMFSTGRHLKIYIDKDFYKEMKIIICWKNKYELDKRLTWLIDFSRKFWGNKKYEYQYDDGINQGRGSPLFATTHIT